MPNSDCIVNFSRGQSQYSGSSPARALNYLERSSDRDIVYGLDGQPLTNSERRNLVEYAKSTGFRRLGTLSLRWGNDLSDREYREGARRFFNHLARDRPSLRVAWSIHRDSKHHHIQFVAIGSKQDCWTNKRDLEHLRELGREYFQRDYNSMFYESPEYGLTFHRSVTPQGWFYG